MFVHRLKKLTQFRSLSTSTSKLTANLNIKSLHDENKLGENITIKVNFYFLFLYIIYVLLFFFKGLFLGLGQSNPKNEINSFP